MCRRLLSLVLRYILMILCMFGKCLNCFGDFDVTLFAVRKYNLSLLGRLRDGLEVVPGIGGAQDWCSMYVERGLEALEIADLHWC